VLLEPFDGFPFISGSAGVIQNLQAAPSGSAATFATEPFDQFRRSNQESADGLADAVRHLHGTFRLENGTDAGHFFESQKIRFGRATARVNGHAWLDERQQLTQSWISALQAFTQRRRDSCGPNLYGGGQRFLSGVLMSAIWIMRPEGRLAPEEMIHESRPTAHLTVIQTSTEQLTGIAPNAPQGFRRYVRQFVVVSQNQAIDVSRPTSARTDMPVAQHGQPHSKLLW
jgi:hypothetical protein